ncbi:hypothetical protein [Methylobacterium sp. J-068]|uniref:hypothetical protein n=1 Tax=Methylobacterium sp. J-068 TaxID=2836649 RepID=UPI001FBA8E5C|nr:hypothetical protein [Methylobacterium sp. J-068]MCJ2035010.1 hypothetical protein [Methylobacterium sp. J-068]
MRVIVLRRLGLRVAVFGLGLLPALALAETTRAWTDPPGREAAGAKVETPKASDAVQAAVPVTQAPARRAKTAKRRPVQRTRVVVAPDVRRRPVAGARPRIAATRPHVRVVTMHPSVYAPPPAPRYGYVVEAAPGRSVMIDDRASRIRRAQEAGYLVIRSRSVEFPDGRRLRTYQPYDEADD